MHLLSIDQLVQFLTFALYPPLWICVLASFATWNPRQTVRWLPRIYAGFALTFANYAAYYAGELKDPEYLEDMAPGAYALIFLGLIVLALEWQNRPLSPDKQAGLGFAKLVGFTVLGAVLGYGTSLITFDQDRILHRGEYRASSGK